MAKAKHPHDLARRELRAFGLGYPGAHPKSPWPGHEDLAVNDKTFAYLNLDGEPLRLSCKLPASGALALTMPNTQPTAYGLGKSGWVSVEYRDDEAPPLRLLKAWIDESYRAQAPRKRVKELDASASPLQARPAKAQPARRRPKAKPATRR